MHRHHHGHHVSRRQSGKFFGGQSRRGNRFPRMRGDRPPRRGSTHYIPVGERGPFSYPIHVNAEILGRHINLNRTPFLPYLPELLTRPQGAWLTFERHKATKKIALRLRLLRVVQADKQRGMVMIANAHAGHLEGWTFIPMSKPAILQKQRRGMLIASEEN